MGLPTAVPAVASRCDADNSAIAPLATEAPGGEMAGHRRVITATARRCQSVWRRGRREEGQALIEMAIALPVLLLLLIGIIQFGLLLNKYITLTDAARAGARELAIQRGDDDPCDPAIQQALIAGSDIGLQATQVTPSFTTMTSTTTTGTTSTTTTPNECSTGTYTYNANYNSSGNTNTTGNVNEGDEATISASQPFQLSVFGLGVMNLTLTATASDAIE